MSQRIAHPTWTVEQRFWRFVEKTDTCWLWTGAKFPKGYGRMYRSHDNSEILAHRVSWVLANGRAVPDGLEVDHLCRVKLCVNPAHLEAVTPWENKRRSNTWAALPKFQLAKTHCPQGHEYTPENTYTRPKAPNNRHCRTCKRIQGLASYYRVKARRESQDEQQ